MKRKCKDSKEDEKKKSNGSRDTYPANAANSLDVHRARSKRLDTLFVSTDSSDFFLLVLVRLKLFQTGKIILVSVLFYDLFL
jgi:hypothetical protein